MPFLRILISNDDGIFAEGIQALAAEAVSRGHQVTVVCPDQERSATGHGLTMQAPLRAERADALFAPGVTAWACSGTPSDCVKLALGRLLERPPELVLSGINHGPNLGTDVFYSGTVSAAMEGTLEGLRALAVSSACFQWRHFAPAATLTLDVAERMVAAGWPAGLLLNLNVPALPAGEIGPLRWCRPAVRRYIDQFDKRLDPRGRTYYWLAGEVVFDLESGTAGPADWPTDVAQIHAGGAALTPLQPELFWRGSVAELPSLPSMPSRPSLSPSAGD
ncbi:5'/3'-nucleotidase SurE [Synechococcus sp. CS-602]|uniref:5'/3'-nucleotidase SurE n=1 Tax=unclassified Synechococcus TaxID=2626047 RepID=UPI0008FF5592|nr:MULTISPECIES: 5'/3'-nucleotidase SurE [unclassified Synechococcus]MCT4365943.1 5'/3'-nucleotidase SurE [Candidatus Regnicoccus frigidus MAG-AL1]APD48803.1 5'/3'-nucleotidase SurE [Synechococcus sp. SynAce01]MCT0203558.1 5'/3'-nucleotidase SurE [Synechococcus sp. CS-602]MCT0245483.1 5'/3'-nucleotidase SurE [Synechococcus sp. CS-601]TWB88624.1 5'-nucleotidase /3'-nucleotidase /exopolyphosphatase [Synechococcus sp. Ace-Pa]